MIKITAETRRARITETELLTSGSAGIQCQFTFTEDWNGLNKMAVFRQGDDGEKYDIILDETNTCLVPWETLTVDGEVLFIGVYGSNAQGIVIIPTVWASAGVVKPGVEPNTPSQATPTPDVWTQILDIAEDAKETADDALSIAEQAESDVATAIEDCSQYATTASNAADAAVAAQGYAEAAQLASETAQAGSKAEALKSEGFALGKQAGDDVDSDSPYYHNNSKYFSEQASASATSAGNAHTASETAQGKAETAQGKAEDAQAAAEAAQAAIEEMFPTGGTVGQYLRKQSDTDYDSEWADLPVAEEFNADSVYFEGDYCLHNGDLYRCKIPRGSGTAWNDNRWDKITVADDLNGALGSIAIFWERQAMYNTGAFVVYKGHLYRCKTDNVQAEPTNTTYWEAANLANKLDSKVDKVNGKGLSTNDYTTAEKDKLANLSAGDVAFNKESGYLSGTVGRYLQLLDSEDVQYTYGGEKELGTVGETLDYLADKSVEIGEDVDDLEDAVSELRNTLNAAFCPASFSASITKGEYLAFADGTKNKSANYARTTSFLNGYQNRIAIELSDPTYEMAVMYFDETAQVVTSGANGYVGHSEYSTGVKFIPKEAVKFALNFRKAAKTTLSDADITAISAALSAYTPTDTTLTQSGMAADAKSVRDRGVIEDGVVPQNTDLDYFRNIGLYRVPSGGTIATLTNYPSTYAGRILVLSDENGYFCTQIVITSQNTVFVRILTSVSDNVWTDWASYNGTVFRARGYVRNESNIVDADLFDTNGSYTFSSSEAASTLNLPSIHAGILIVFGSVNLLQVYVNRFNTVYYRFRYNEDGTGGTFTEWLRPLKPDTTLSMSGAAADSKTAGDAIRAEYVHDGNIFMMSSTPDSIPVGDNHYGYNEFIAATWDTLLPNGYQEGDAYNASTTKIHNVFVERESDWTSTPYGSNNDTYTIYRYTFTPQNGYKKTIFLTTGCHGNEAEAYWGIYRLIRMIYFEGYKYPTLRNLRECRLIVVPSWNPWGMQHYRRYNAFAALNVGVTDVAKNYQAWAWLMDSDHKITVNGVEYDISDVGEANVIWETLQDYDGEIDLWIDFHTDPYAGRNTKNVDIDDPRGYTPPYGCYGFALKDSAQYASMCTVMDDFYYILKNEYNFTETWHPQATTGSGSFSAWMGNLGFKAALVEVSTFMNDFPYPSGSAGIMKLAQEYYGNCIAEILR